MTTQTSRSRPARESGRAGRDESGPLLLEQVVAELVDEFVDPRDWPADHRCTKDGPSACWHEPHARRALLVRLAHMLTPGTSAPRDTDGRAGKGVRARGMHGSPPPWAAGPALLVDEAHRGAVRLDRDLRAALDLGPLWVHRGVASRPPVGPVCQDLALGYPEGCTHATCRPARKAITTKALDTPADIAGAAALRGLPLLVELLRERDADHPLVAGPLIHPSHPERGRHWGRVERTVRRWHSQARALTGHEQPPIVLRQRRNPFAGTSWVGPTCQDGWSCGHKSCRMLFLVPLPQWGSALCPQCGTSGFPWDEQSGVLRCDHPRCRDEQGRRSEWSLEAFMRPLDELVEIFGEPR